MRGSVVIYLFSILLANGLTYPTKRIEQKHANDRPVTTAPESKPSTVTVLEASEPNLQEKIPESSSTNEKRSDPLGDRLLNKVKERSLLKIIKKSKRPRYRLRDSILEHDLFSVAAKDDNNNTVSFHDIFNSVKASSLKSNENKTTAAKMPKVEDNKNELITTYLPLKSLGNGSEIEIVKNTILRSNAPSNNKSTNNISVKWGHVSSAKRNLKHQVRKYFRLHSSVAKELDARSIMSRPKPDNSRSSVSDATAAPALKIYYGAYGQTQAPRTQSIVLRWNLILV